MRSTFFLDEYELSKEYALLVLENPSLTETIISEANYALGLSCFHLGNYEEAMVPLEWLVENMTTFMGSEAQFTLAQIHFNKEDLSAAKGEIDQLLKMKPSYDFWIAKGLILKSRILIKEGDLFQSEQNLKAVIEHYPSSDDGILEEANILWDEIMILKNPIIEESEDDNETKIEIDED